MRQCLMVCLVGAALCAHACWESDSSSAGSAGGDGDGSLPGDRQNDAAAAPLEGSFGSGGESAAPTGNGGGNAGQCVVEASQHVSAACAECACAGSRCGSRVADCGPDCWALLACVEIECGGRTDDAECILAACDVSASDSATRAASCVSRCDSECGDDLMSIARPPDGGAPVADGGAQAMDLCPGQAIALTGSTPVTVQGNTTSLGDDYQSYCAKDETGGSDAVYQVTVEQAGTLSIDVSSTAESFDAVLYVESTCGEAASTLACTDRDGLTEHMALPVNGPGTFYVVVESRAGTEGPFSAAFALTAAACGDGAVNPGEECDFGDLAPGDGCDASCQYEIPADASDVCPGEVDTLVAGGPKAISGFTVGYSDDYDAPCGAETGAPDRVFAFNPQQNGTLNVNLSSSFDGVLSIYETCNVPNLFDLRLCSDSPRASAAESISIDVIGGAQYFVVVDGYRQSSMGTFELTVELAP